MTVKQLQELVNGKLKRHYGVVSEDANPKMIYDACALVVRDMLMEKWVATQECRTKRRLNRYVIFRLNFCWGVLCAIMFIIWA